MNAEGFVVNQYVYVAGVFMFVYPTRIFFRSKRKLVPFFVVKTKSNVIAEVYIPQQYGNVFFARCPVHLIGASPLQNPFYAFTNNSPVTHFAYKTGQLIVVNKFCVTKNDRRYTKQFFYFFSMFDYLLFKFFF